MSGRKGSGGRGGVAYAEGEDSSAEGGAGGEGVIGDGGRGGDARADARKSKARGGKGGRGGIGPGMPGGNAHTRSEPPTKEFIPNPSDTWIEINGEMIALARGGDSDSESFAVGENSFVAGGQGAESSQADGRGGRGGRAYMDDETRERLGLPARRHMRWPYYEPITEPGRGGDAPDTPQYKARRLIVERLKRWYFHQKSLPLAEAWWDRDVVPLDWINERLASGGHRWRVAVVDDEYEFTDL